MRRLMTRIVAGVGALVVAGLMTACAPRPTTAALVGPQRIAVSEVTQLIDSLPENLRTQSALGHPSVVLSIRMRGLAAEQVAQQRGITNLEGLAEKSVAELPVPEELRHNEGIETLLIAQEKTAVLADQIGAQEMESAFQRIPVTINPRFGLTGLGELESLHNTSLSRLAS